MDISRTSKGVGDAVARECATQQYAGADRTPNRGCLQQAGHLDDPEEPAGKQQPQHRVGLLKQGASRSTRGQGTICSEGT